MAPTREYLFGLHFLFYMTQVIWADDNLFLDILSFNSSTVDLACRYEGDKKDIFFNVYRESDSCIFYKSACNHYPQNDCKLQCKKSSEENAVLFSVELDGSCQAKANIRCSVRSLTDGQELDLDSFLVLTPQSDPPEILIDDQRLVLDFKQVPLACRVTNTCDKANLEISGVHMTALNTSHTVEGSRFTTKAETSAIFNEAGNYTISCKEAGKDDSFSSFHFIEVLNPTGTTEKPERSDYKFVLAATIPSFILLTSLLCCLMVYCNHRKRSRDIILGRELLEEGIPLRQSGVRGETENEFIDRYLKIENIIQQLTFSNIDECVKEITQILTEGEITYPEVRPSIVHQLVGKCEKMIKTPNFVQLIKELGPSYRESALSKKENLSELIWKHLESLTIDCESEANLCINKLKIFLPLDDNLSCRLLWMFVMNAKSDQKELAWNSHFVGVLTFLMREGANPFAKHEGTSAFTTFLAESDFHLQESNLHAIETFIEESAKAMDSAKTDESTLNDIIQSVPNVILEESSGEISSIKADIVKICLEMIDTNACLCNQSDNEGRTPLHNLMEKLFINDGWKQMPKVIEGTDILLNFMSRLISASNVNAKDKDNVTPYSWLCWWRESMKKQNVEVSIDLEKKIQDMFKLIGIDVKGKINEDPQQEVKHIRYKLMHKKILHLNMSNIADLTKEILDILNEGDIQCPTQGPISFIKVLVKELDTLFKEPSYAELIKALHQVCKQGMISWNADIFDVIWKQLKFQWIRNGSEAQECVAKLQIFLPLDTYFSTRFLYELIHRCDGRERNVYFVEVLTFLISKGANPFQLIGETVSFTLFYEKFFPHLNDSLLSSVKAFIEETFYHFGVTKREECIVNEIIKSIPNKSYQGRSSPYSNVVELIVGNCLNMIQRNPAICDHVDGEGRTPLHNFMQKVVRCGWWERLPDLVAGTDNVLKLMCHLITKKNVNTGDKDQVTPYTWVLLCEESIAFHDVQYTLKYTGPIEHLKHFFLTKGANEEDATRGLTTIRERELEGLLKTLITFHKHMDHKLTESGKTSEEIIAELKDVEMDVDRIRDLKSKGCGECITLLTRTDDFVKLVKEHIEIRNDRILGISGDILQVMIVEDNAKKIYYILLEHKRYREGEGKAVNYYALFDVLKWCLDNGAHPTIAEIHEISLLTVEECTTYEALSATVQVLKQLIGVYRKRGNIGHIEKVYLNPMQGVWCVKEDLRAVAGEVIRAAYGTLCDCIKSESVINMLLFVSKEDSEDSIKECFNEAGALLQRDMRAPPVTKWIKEKGKHVYHGLDLRQIKELRWTLIKRNDNWLRRSVLHLAAIFCHEEKVLNCISKELIERQIDTKDLNGCTPLDLAQLHGNTTAITFLECHDARLSAQLFGKFTRFSCADLNTHYKNYCSDILKIESTGFEQMKKMLFLPVHECIAIENNLKELFARIVANDGFLDAEIVMGGSAKEKLKVGRWDEFDLHICTKIKPHFKGKGAKRDAEYEPFACLKMHEYLVKRLAEVDKKGIYLLCVSVGIPCKFIWEGEGSCRGLEISVDVVPIYVKGNASRKDDRQGLIIDEAPGHLTQLHLKWKDLESKPDWNETLCRLEWDILDSLPPGCRLGILISKALLEAQDYTSKANLIGRQITSYVIKNTLLWLLAGMTPKDIEKDYGNVIREKFGVLRQQLHFTPKDPKWMTEEDVERFAEDGRFWAEKIFDTIEFVAKECRQIPGSFLENESKRLDEAHEIIDVLDTCGRCLEKLKPHVFYSEEAYISKVVQEVSDSGLRTRLHEVIERLNEEAEKVSGGRLWKMRKEVKRLNINFDKSESSRDKRRLKQLEEEMDKLLLEYADETQLKLLKKEERTFEELDEQIKREMQRFLAELGHVNNKESVLFRIKGEIEELEGICGEFGYPAAASKQDATLTRKRRECSELKMEVEALRHDKKWHEYLDKMDKMISNLFQEEKL